MSFYTEVKKAKNKIKKLAGIQAILSETKELCIV
jgi:hypothetical protein